MEISSKSPVFFIKWWSIKIPTKLFNTLKRITQLVNNKLAFSLNLKLFFTPLYGDYTFIGRLIGLTMRIFFIGFGSIFVLFLGALTFLAPVAWYLLPIALIYFLDVWSIAIFVFTYVSVINTYKNTPMKKVSDVAQKDIELCFRPLTLYFTNQMSNKNSYAINNFFAHPDIKKIFSLSELPHGQLADKLIKATLESEFKSLKNEAFEIAGAQKTRYVELEHLLYILLSHIKNVDTILAEHKANAENITQAISWVVEKRENLSKLFVWQDDYEKPLLSGFGHGLTGRVTPALDAISYDYTKEALTGSYVKFKGREELITRILRTLDGSNTNLLLVGDPGSGKTSIIKNLANRIARGTDVKTIQNKRIVGINLGSLLSGAKTYGDIADKLEKALDNAVGSGDIILFIDEIHTLASALGEEQEGQSNVFSILQPHLASNKIRFIGATNVVNYRKYIEPVGYFANLFEVIDVAETDFDETLTILKDAASDKEREHGIVITMPALLAIIKLSKKLVHDRVFPDKAIDILNRACNLATVKSDKMLTTAEVEHEISIMTRIPVEAVNPEESQKLLKLEEEMKKRVVGQDHAVSQVAAAIKRARVGMRDESKPIASFLFVGTTGVGKTETAKTLSQVYFGDNKAMIRLDMSEYQQPDSIDKLIGTSDGKTKGILTELVRSKPFSVVLLDEIEKAHSQVILTFLQVLDDGRLTNSQGLTTDFTNSIIIATSNVGTQEIQELTQQDVAFAQIEEVATKAVRNRFAPEFLNRFTAIVVYKPLDKDALRKITLIMLERVRRLAAEKSIKVSFKDELVEHLMEKGYTPQWGARPMARLIESTVENYLADQILKENIKQGADIVVGTEVFSN